MIMNSDIGDVRARCYIIGKMPAQGVVWTAIHVKACWPVLVCDIRSVARIFTVGVAGSSATLVTPSHIEFEAITHPAINDMPCLVKF